MFTSCIATTIDTAFLAMYRGLETILLLSHANPGVVVVVVLMMMMIAYVG